MSHSMRRSSVNTNTNNFTWPKSGNPISKEKQQQDAKDVKQFVLNAKTANNFTQWKEGLDGCTRLYKNYNTGANNTRKNTKIAKKIKKFIDKQKKYPLTKTSTQNTTQGQEEKGNAATATTPAAPSSSSAHNSAASSGVTTEEKKEKEKTTALLLQSAQPVTTNTGNNASASSTPKSPNSSAAAATATSATSSTPPASSGSSVAAAATTTTPNSTLPPSPTKPAASSAAPSASSTGESKTTNYDDLMTAFDTQIQPVLNQIEEDDELTATELARKIAAYRNAVKTQVLDNPDALIPLTTTFQQEATDIIRQAKGNDHILHGLIAGIVVAALMLIAFVVGMVLTGTPIGLLAAQPLTTATPMYALGTAIGLGTITGVAASLFSRSSQTAPVDKVLEAKDTFEAAVNARRAAGPTA